MLVQYVKKQKRSKTNPNHKYNIVVGLVLGDKMSDGHFYYGYSLCNFKEGDKFDRQKAYEIAIGRLNSKKIPGCFGKIPHTVLGTMKIIQKRLQDREDRKNG